MIGIHMTGDKAAIFSIDTAPTTIDTVDGKSSRMKKSSRLGEPSGVTFDAMQINQRR